MKMTSNPKLFSRCITECAVAKLQIVFKADVFKQST